MTTENSGEAVCVECGHGYGSHRAQDEKRGVRAYCANCTQADQALWLHAFHPASENSEGSVPASTDRIQEARENISRCDYCKGSGGFSDTTMGRGGYGGQMLTMCPRCKGVGFDLTEFEARVRESVEEEQREAHERERLEWIRSVAHESSLADNALRELEEQREKYQELVKALIHLDNNGGLEVLGTEPKPLADALNRVAALVAQAERALSSTEIKGETAGRPPLTPLKITKGG